MCIYIYTHVCLYVCILGVQGLCKVISPVVVLEFPSAMITWNPKRVPTKISVLQRQG